MQIRNSPDRWGAVQQALHWVVAPLALLQLWLGAYVGELPEESLGRSFAFGLHATIGLTILLLMLARLAWRLANPVPLMPQRLGPRARRAARATHYGFYALLIAQPISGYLLAGAQGEPVRFYAWSLPAVIEAGEGLEAALFSVHLVGATLLFAAAALHTAGALRHEFVLKDNTLRRMTPIPPRDGDYAARTTRKSSESEAAGAGRTP